MYYCLVFCILYILVTTQAFNQDDILKCERFFRPNGMDCCKKQNFILRDIKDKEECLELLLKPNCEGHICFAKKAGFGFDDGKVDKEALNKLLEKQFANNQEILKEIKDECVNGDLNKYGPPEFCELVKMKACIDVLMMKECPEWDSTGQCSGAEEASKECISAFA